jgi:hypothetical protein
MHHSSRHLGVQQRPRQVLQRHILRNNLEPKTSRRSAEVETPSWLGVGGQVLAKDILALCEGRDSRLKVTLSAGMEFKTSRRLAEAETIAHGRDDVV